MKIRLTKSKAFYLITQLIMLLVLIISMIFFFISKEDYQKSRLLFNSIQAVMFIFITFLSRIINKNIKYNIPDFMIIIFEIFCICHFILGEINQFYIRIKWWDSMLHTLSGFMLGILGFSFASLFKNNENNNIAYTVMFSICFAISVGALWEIVEFGIDSLFKTNMQRYINDQTNELLIGQKALQDTMKDLILDFIGSSLAAIIGGLSIKLKGNAFNSWNFRKNNKLLLKRDL